MNKNSNKLIDILRDMKYNVNIESDCSYEQKLVEIMIDEDCTLSAALEIDFDQNMIDKSSVIGMVDYLEEMLTDLDKVELLMNIYTRRAPDMYLTPL